jgi:hypothetical protein
LIRPGSFFRTQAVFFVSAATFILGAQPLAAHEFVQPPATPTTQTRAFVRRSSFHLKTNAEGHLQRLLQESYPDSFTAGVDMFWEPRDGWVSREVFEWWTSRAESRGLNKQAAEEMFTRISDGNRVFSDLRERQICAVVGPSRNLLGSGYGRLIDAHDFVIRMNRAPRDGFESDVGTRTTHHLTWPIQRLEHEADRKAFLLVTPVTLHTVELFDRILEDLESAPAWDLRRVRIINPEFVMYVHLNWLDKAGAFPSTGFIALMMAVHVCDEVSVFGFGGDADGRWDRYYSEERAVGSHLHAADTEAHMMREMEEKGIFKVYLGNRSRDGVEFPGFQVDEHDDQ